MYNVHVFQCINMLKNTVVLFIIHNCINAYNYNYAYVHITLFVFYTMKIFK